MNQLTEPTSLNSDLEAEFVSQCQVRASEPGQVLGQHKLAKSGMRTQNVARSEYNTLKQNLIMDLQRGISNHDQLRQVPFHSRTSGVSLD